MPTATKKVAAPQTLVAAAPVVESQPPVKEVDDAADDQLSGDKQAHEALGATEDAAEDDESVAVGAVAHVMRRAFHAFYLHQDAVAAKESTPASDGEGASAEHAADVTTATDEEEATPASAAEPLASSLQEPKDQRVQLGEARKAQIESERQLKREAAAALLSFLDERHRAAHDVDDAIARELSDKGLVIKAQIPMGPTNLRLDAADVAGFGAFGADLVHATQLVSEYHARRRERSGNGPDALGHLRAAAPGIVPEPLGYLESTGSSAVRTRSTLEMHQRHIDAVKTHHSSSSVGSSSRGASGASNTTTITDNSHSSEEGHLPSTADSSSPVPGGLSSTSSGTHKPEKEEAKMTAVERRKNMEILDRMQTKLAFLRNPRYASDDTGGSGSSGASHDPPAPASCFVVVPSPVEFTDYDIGGVYEQLVYVRNTSHLSRRLRVLPPATIFFSIDEITFPDPSGLVAPGMHVQLRLRFAPDSRADYKDAMRVAHECAGSGGGVAEFAIPLAARRTPPELSIPLVLRAQNTLVGSYSVTPLVCRNSGGKARFWLMTEDEWARYEASSGAALFLREQSESSLLAAAANRTGQLAVGAFTLSPSEMELGTGESVTLQLQYVPSCVGEQRSKFVMVCDNCLVRVFQVVGRGCQVELAVTGVNDKQVDASIVHMGALDHVVFDAVAVNAHTQQRLVVTNDTPIALAYAWRFERVRTGRRRGPSCSDGDDAVGDEDAAEPPFQIAPSSGVIALNAALEFVVAFAPTRARVHRWRAALLVHGVPQCSMPGPQQRALLTTTFQSLQASLASVKLESVEALSVRLDGTGLLGRFSVAPSYWNFCGSGDGQHAFLQKHSAYSTRVVLRNPTSAPVAFEVDLASVAQRHSRPAPRAPRTLQAVGSDESRPAFELTASPLVGELPPNAQVTIEVAFTPHCVGAFSLALPIRIPVAGARAPRRRSGFVRWLLLEGCVARGDVEIVSPEVDFGLVLVGTSAETTLTFRNRAPVPAEWRFLHVEAASEATRHQQQLVGGGGGRSASLQLATSMQSSFQRSGSRDSIASRRSSISNGSSGGNDTSRSSNFLFSARDALPRATVSFAPETGTLAPGETRSIKVVCIAGSLPERLRASFSCQLSPERLFLGGAASSLGGASVSARAEIQAPNVFLSPAKLQLGTTYLGVAVRRTLQLVNVSNLEASFKFVEPQGLSKAYAVEFAPKTGTLCSKETLAVVLTYTPRQAGRTTALFACTVRGLTTPLGGEVATNQKGLVLSYELVPSPTSSLVPKSPKEVALERGISIADCDLEPDANPLSSVPRLLFGDAIPLGQRSALHVLIRNFSGIEAVIELEAKKFPASTRASSPVAPAPRPNNSSHSSSSSLPSPLSPSSPLSKSSSKSGLGSSTGSLRKTKSSHPTTTSRKKLLIGDAHEQLGRFQSENGRNFVRQCAEDMEDREMLDRGHGVAFQLRPSHVRIPPWEQLVVTVLCFNNMPGSYADDIVSRAAGIPPVFLHAQATVVGTPLAFDRNCVGLSFPTKKPTTKPPQQQQQQLLQEQPTFHFGQLCTKSPPLTRTLRVVNRGPKQARLKWKLVESGKENQLVNVSLRVDFNCRVQLRVAVCEEDDRAFPFSVAPEQAVVPPFATVPFHITYTPPEAVAAARVLLLADAHWYDVVAPERGRSGTELQGGGHGDDDSALTDSRCEAPSPSPSNQSSNSSREHPTTAAGKAFAAVRAANSLFRRSAAPGLSTTSATPSHVSARCLRVLLGADVIEPELFLDRSTSALSGDTSSIQLSAAVASAPSSRAKSPYHLKFTTWSTIAASASDVAHAFHRQELFLVNHLSTRLTFRLESVGPFAVFRADSLAPRHPLSSADLPPAHRRAQGETFLFTLPPQMSVRIDLRFDPTQVSLAAGVGAHPLVLASNAASLARRRLPSLATSKQQQQSHQQHHQQQQKRLKTVVEGQLLIKFTNRSVQRVGLAAEIIRPLVVVSPSVYFFGHVHLSASRSVVLRLANPTAVPALFSVAHVPAPVPLSKAQRHEFALHHAHYVDDPSVFTFSTMSGTVAGPTTSLASSGGALPSTNSTRDLGAHPLVFAPVCVTVVFRAAGVRKRYKSRFRFVVAHGVDFEVVLEGEGHLGERAIEDQGRSIVRTRALEHSNQIFTKILQ